MRASARPLRSLADVEVEVGEGVTAVLGENGSGKTNLLEAVYFALTGRSFRTSDRRQMIPFGGSLARAELRIESDEGSHSLLASVSRTEGRRHLIDGATLDYHSAVRRRPAVAVFSPDRLTLIKGPPAERRAHLDLFAAALWPSRANLRRDYGRALAQRNALLARINAGRAGLGELASWDATLAATAAPLSSARAEAAAELAPRFAALAGELGLPEEAGLRYSARAEGDADAILSGLAERREMDLRMGRTSWGPHLDEIHFEHGSRSLRRYGSQGQQRVALLALLFAERGALLSALGNPPLLLLDDVLSELDGSRRERLVELLGVGGQALLTATGADVVPPGLASGAILMPQALPARGAAAA